MHLSFPSSNLFITLIIKDKTVLCKFHSRLFTIFYFIYKTEDTFI